jgi:predicted outer membrane repeat protein
MRLSKLYPALIILALSFNASFLCANIINVPGDHPNIQAAITASSTGDTILVQPATYNEHINFNGKAITVGSLFLTTADENYISSTIINGSGTGSCVKFNSGETSASVLSGFTLTNGYAYYGAGINCYSGSSPTLSYLDISNNNGHAGDSYGGGLVCMDGSSPICSNLTFTDNYANEGGGVWCHNNGDATFSECVFSGNNSSHGGAMQISYSDPVIDHSLFYENDSPFGGAVYVFNYSSPEFINCTFSENTSTYGGAFYCSDLGGQPTITNCILWNDVCSYNLEIFATSSIYPPIVTYSDIENGSSQSWFSTGCIDSDPLFEDPSNDNYHLTASSPCIDAGDPASPPDPDGSVADMGAFFYGDALVADFTVSDNDICVGETVQFIDNSIGNIVSWDWSFEGGSPATSSSQNPSVTYNAAGNFDVQLTVYNGTVYDTYLQEDFITVSVTPAQANTPTGPSDVCGGFDYEYTTNTVQYASDYEWHVEPADAGSITGNDTIGTFHAAGDWTGSYSIKVRAENDCGSGNWSAVYSGELHHNPSVFQLSDGGGYCLGDPGIELTLEGSETGVDYELYLDDVTTGNIVAGTGSVINFGYQLDEGIYTAKGYTDHCLSNMIGSPWIYMVEMPAQAGIPAGPESVCNNDETTYNTSGAANADTLIWTLDPGNAGAIMGSGSEITVLWDDAFSGSVNLTVFGRNICGDGAVSDPIVILVDPAPIPAISGLSLVCDDEIADYSTPEIIGNSYEWNVTGGTIIGGAGTYQVTVHWGSPGTGILTVSETNQHDCTGLSDEFAVSIDNCTGIEDRENDFVSIFPNPANNYLNIEFGAAETGKCRLNILSILGHVMYSDHNISLKSNQSLQINISDYPEGIYIIRFQTNQNTIFQKKIIKIN